MTLTTRLRRLRWRWEYRAVRRAAAVEPLTPDLVQTAWARSGHLNTATGQWADVILARGREAGITPKERTWTLCTCGRQGRPHRDHSGPFGLGQHATVHRTPPEWVEIASGRWRGRQGSLVAKANTRPGGNGGTVFIVALNEGRTVRVRSIRTVAPEETT